jgi:transcriptional regulator with XRE-family HTH domain
MQKETDMNASEEASLVGRGIRTLRMKKRITQAQLAALSGLRAGRIKSIENGWAPEIGERELQHIAIGLDMEPDHFAPTGTPGGSTTKPKKMRVAKKTSRPSKAGFQDDAVVLQQIYHELPAKYKRLAFGLMQALAAYAETE